MRGVLILWILKVDNGIPFDLMILDDEIRAEDKKLLILNNGILDGILIDKILDDNIGIIDEIGMTPDEEDDLQIDGWYLWSWLKLLDDDWNPFDRKLEKSNGIPLIILYDDNDDDESNWNIDEMTSISKILDNKTLDESERSSLSVLDGWSVNYPFQRWFEGKEIFYIHYNRYLEKNVFISAFEVWKDSFTWWEPSPHQNLADVAGLGPWDSVFFNLPRSSGPNFLA
jgi:hypothetical protein